MLASALSAFSSTSSALRTLSSRPSGRDHSTSSGDRPLKDRMLMAAIGEYVGLTLENLRQREEVRSGQERTRALLNAIPDTMVRATRDGTVTDYKERETGSSRLLALG